MGRALHTSRTGFKASGTHAVRDADELDARRHMTADMMHDSMRGVVFRAMYAAITAMPTMVQDTEAEREALWR